MARGNSFARHPWLEVREAAQQRPRARSRVCCARSNACLGLLFTWRTSLPLYLSSELSAAGARRYDYHGDCTLEI
jgi:hypothetical protein